MYDCVESLSNSCGDISTIPDACIDSIISATLGVGTGVAYKSMIRLFGKSRRIIKAEKIVLGHYPEYVKKAERIGEKNTGTR